MLDGLLAKALEEAFVDVFRKQDPVFTPAVMASLAGRIRGCPEPMLIPEGRYFVQEHGAVIAQETLCALA